MWVPCLWPRHADRSQNPQAPRWLRSRPTEDRTALETKLLVWPPRRPSARRAAFAAHVFALTAWRLTPYGSNTLPPAVRGGAFSTLLAGWLVYRSVAE